MVVRTHGGGERHARALSLPAVRRSSPSSSPASPCSSPPAAATTSEPARRRPRPPRRPPPPTSPARGLRERRDAGAQGRSASSRSPKEKLDKTKTYVATVTTTCGDFEITLDAKRAPKTGGSFKYLADQGFFDGTTFHRIVAGLRDPGRRPGRQRHRRPRLLASTRRRRATSSTRAASSRWPRPAPSRPAPRASQFFVVTGEDAAAAARLRAARQGHGRPGRRGQDRRRPGRPGRRAARSTRSIIDVGQGHRDEVTPYGQRALELEQRELALRAAAVVAEPPLPGSTRWQGTTIGIGLRAQAVPTARAACGLPARAASSP